MGDYIKREDAIKSIKPMVGIWADDGRFYVDYQRVLDIINNEPSADVVEVVRCKDCKHWLPHTQFGYDDDEYHDYCGCRISSDEFDAERCDANDYCSSGEKKDE